MEFKPIAIEDGERFREYASHSSYMGTEICFTDMFCWGRHYGVEIAFEDDFCFIRSVPKGDEKKAVYHYPFGVGNEEKALEKLLSLAENSEKKTVSAIDDERRDLLEGLFPGKFRFEERRQGFDYIYLSSSLSTLSGKKLHQKKNHLNKFLKSYPEYTVEELSEKNFDECISVNREWCKNRGEESDSPCENDGEFCAVRRTLNHFNSLGCRGILLRVSGNPIAFTIGTPIRENLFITHFEKALTEYEGAFAAVNKLFADRLTEFEYINREEDMGIEGLRQAKLGYHPAILYRKYHGKIIV